MPKKTNACPHCGKPKDARAKQCHECYYNRGPQTTIEQRFWMKVDRRSPNECWPWKGARNPHGYGLLGNPGKNTGQRIASRVSWEIHHGPIPDGMAICHHCDNPICVNPAHLFLGTTTDNNQDRHRKGRDGHAFGEHNGAHTRPDKVARGTGHYAARFTDDDIQAIRAAKPATGVREAAERVAEQYGRSPNYIIKIWYGYKWKHLDPPPTPIKRR